MPGIEGKKAKNVLPIIYVIDVSGSMEGDRIATVNNAIRNCGTILQEKAESNPDSEVRLSVLTFSNGAKWLTGNTLVELDHFFWNDANASGMTDLGAALHQLEVTLGRSTGFLKTETGLHMPVIIFMSDGYPTDNWKSALNDANANNKWFKDSRKIAIAIGDDADKNVLSEICGDKEAVITIDKLADLKEMIVDVSVRASLLGGQSITTGAQMVPTPDPDPISDPIPDPIPDPDPDPDPDPIPDGDWPSGVYD